MFIIVNKFKKERELKRDFQKTNALDIDMKNPEFENGILLGAKCCQIQEAYIPRGVQKINPNAFFDCKQLKTVLIPKTVTHIGDNAFAGCENLEEVTIPASVQYIGNRAFHNCRNLKRVIFEGKEKVYARVELGSFVFAGCESLEEVKFNESLLYVPSYAFYDCKSLTQLELPDSCQQVREKAFEGSGIEKLRLGVNLLVDDFDLTSIKNLNNLSEISIPRHNANAYSSRLFVNGIHCRVVEEIDYQDKVKMPIYDKEEGMVR